MKDGKIESRLEAVRITERLWYWLSLEDGRKKEDWPRWSEYGSMINNCPCCEYSFAIAKETGVGSCSNCPLAGKWSLSGERLADECETHGSPYSDWKWTKDNARYARTIYLLARDERLRLLKIEEAKELEIAKKLKEETKKFLLPEFTPITITLENEEEAHAL